MRGKRWLVAGVVAILLAAPGCVCCGNKSYAVAHEMGAECEVPTCQRNQVYVFAVSGMNPAGVVALDSLREELNRQGFAKVGTGQTIHAWWMAREMRRIRSHEPDAVFVIVGSEAGGPAAVGLAEKAKADGLPVAAVVLLDADGQTPPPAPSPGTRAIAIGAAAVPPAFGVESVAVPGVGRFDLPTDANTVATLTALLNDVAQAGVPPTVEHVLGWWYPGAPPARPVVDPGHDPQWAFLFDDAGAVPSPLGERGPVITATPAAPAPTYTSAQR
jgi:hypothetical protein